jgi:segregation and condensation protein B
MSEDMNDDVNKNMEDNLSDVVELPELPALPTEEEMGQELEAGAGTGTEAGTEAGAEDEAGAEVEVESEEMTELDRELLWKAKTGLNLDTLCGAIETILFMSDKPLGVNKIKSFIDEDIPLRTIQDCLDRLEEQYDQKHHGIRLQEVAEGFQFRTKTMYSKFVQDLFKVTALTLTPSALEILAIIAYKQPVSKTEIDKIRGVDSAHIVRALIDKRLVKSAGRSDEEIGRPTLYSTTKEFLEVFSLNDLSDLPPEHELQELTESKVGEIADIKTLVQAGDKSKFVYDELQELDALTTNIKSISAHTEFTKSLKNEEKKSVENKTQRKTAFELLEDFINANAIKTSNQEAAASELFSPCSFPEVISDLSLGPFNVPNGEDEDEEDFEMIDLDSGLPISESPLMVETSEEMDANQLKTALEAATLKFMSDNSFESLEEESVEDLNNLDELVENLETSAKEAIEEGHKLDIDLDFLAEAEDAIDALKFEENMDTVDKEEDPV